MKFFLLFIFVGAALARSSSYNGLMSKVSAQRMKCGYDSCHPTKEGVLNVHLVPHTHDDVGWLKTVDQYYYGSRTGTQRAGVQYIIESVIDELLKDEDRRFVYVETAFFKQWWDQQSDERKHEVMHLVHHGRLEFAGGAWSMNDEGATHYHSVLDQMTWGLRVLNDTFGPCATPKTAWQIDPFGHSREFSNMVALAGYDGLFVARIDQQDKENRIKNREMEMILRGSDDIGQDSDLLYGMLYNHYSAPPGFCFDILCNDDPIIDDPMSLDNNVNSSVTKFVNFVKEQANAFKTNHVILTMGEDFHYQDAVMNFKNMDKLMKYVNEKEPSMNLIYSTPACYLKGLHESNVRFSTKQDDFFPYASNYHEFWTGYFTSRPNSKLYERRGNNMLQVCKQLNTLVNLKNGIKNDLIDLKTAMGIMQHHDAATGTEKQHVANDYHRLISVGIKDCLNVTTEAINTIMSTTKSKKKLDMTSCKLNETDCDVTEKSKKFVVTLYNPLSREVDSHVRLPVNGKKYEVRDGKGMVVHSEIIPIPKGSSLKKSGAPSELFFRAYSVPAVGYMSYFVEEVQTVAHDHVKDDDLTISNDHLTVKVDKDTGYLSHVDLHLDGSTTTIPLHQEILYYEGMAREPDRRPSGAYIFRPNGTDATRFEKPENTVFKGEKVQEIHQKFSEWAKQVIRLYKEERHVEFEWVVGPIPINDNIGKEVISRFTSNLKTDAAFYTDSNGRQLLKRIRDKRPTWDIDLREPIAGNYYPVSSMIGVKESGSKKEMFVLTDRNQGGSSIKDGEIELMVHRRLLYDDSLGVGEPLNETVDGVGIIAKGHHYLVLGDEGFGEMSALVRSRMMALEKLLQPVLMVASADDMSYEEWRNNKNEFSGISSLPPNVHLLTLEPWKDGSVLLRLENYFQKDEHPAFNTATVDLQQLFPGMKVVSMRETTLAGNQWKDETTKLSWKFSGTMKSSFNEAYSRYSASPFWLDLYRERKMKKTEEKKSSKDGFMITLGPMEIKTFVVRVEFMN